MADLFDVVADPTRRQLLETLLEHSRAGGESDGGEMSVGALVTELVLSQPTVSKHLKTLREFGLVSVREQGQHRYYRLEVDRLEPLAEWVTAFLPEPELVAEPAEIEIPVSPRQPLPPRIRTVAGRLGAAAASVTVRMPGHRRFA